MNLSRQTYKIFYYIMHLCQSAQKSALPHRKNPYFCRPLIIIVMDYRIEKDSLGEVRVPAEALWGAQTERARLNFVIGTQPMPTEISSLKFRVRTARHPVSTRSLSNKKISYPAG